MNMDGKVKQVYFTPVPVTNQNLPGTEDCTHMHSTLSYSADLCAPLFL